MTTPRDHLLALARRNAAVYLAHTQPRAIMVTGSVADDACDFFSDIDMSVYYDTLPSEAACEAARAALGGENWRFLGDRANDDFIEMYQLDGVECQVGHVTIAKFEQDVASVMEGLDVDSPFQKALEGTLKCIPLHGEDIIMGFKARVAQYPEPLARAMVERGLRFYPIWRLADFLAPRDATIWTVENIVENAYNILRVLAGLNRLYFTSFQLKRTTAFTKKLAMAPDNLAPRLESLFNGDHRAALGELERLVGETLTLVETHLPDVDTAKVRATLGKRVTSWKIPSDIS